MESISLEELREKAFSIGWDDIGITSAEMPKEDIEAYQKWLTADYHGDLAYMQNQVRCSPEQLLPGARTAILFITYYKQEKMPFKSDKGLVASYARGRDYHNVHRKRLKAFIAWLEMRTGMTEIAKGFSDSTPILEKALAVKAGLGWFGKNTLLIHRRFGTFTLLSGVLTTLDLPCTGQEMNLRLPRCGNCTRCLDACPTQAFASPYQLDARRCLSYHLIESKKPIPKEIQQQNPGYVFGCDVCQDVCPHNVRKKSSSAIDFLPEKGMGSYLDEQSINEIKTNPEILFGTPLQRKGAAGLEANFLTLKLEKNDLDLEQVIS
jgi:epoxyqueuosine reductase